MKYLLVFLLLNLATTALADNSFMQVQASNMDDLEDSFKERLDHEAKGENILLHWDFEKTGGTQEFGYDEKDGKCHNKTSRIRDIIYYNSKLKNWFQFAADKTYGTIHLACESTFEPDHTKIYKCGGNLERHGKNQKCFVDQNKSTFTQLGLEFFGDNITDKSDLNINQQNQSDTFENKTESSLGSSSRNSSDTSEQ